jgi:hypothetical protein
MARKKRATDETLGELHQKVAEVLRDALNDKENLTPQLIAQAIKFLDNNGIQGEVGQLEDDVKKASKIILPTFDDDEV